MLQRRFRLKPAIILGSVLAVGMISYSTSGLAKSGRGAQVFLFQEKLPDQGSKRGKRFNLIKFAKRHRAKFLKETEEAKLRDRRWIAKMVVAFPKPPGDSQLNLVYYDISSGRRFITSQTVFLRGSRTEKHFLQTIKLYREEFIPNRPVELVVTMGQYEVGRTKFTPRGAVPKRNNKIDFSDDEA